MSDVQNGKIQFGKIRTTETFYDGLLAHEKKELEIQRATSKRTFLADIIDLTTDALSGNCKKMELTITANDQGVKMITMVRPIDQQKSFRYK